MLPDLLALDLDGTLLPHSKRLSARTRAAVAGARERGVQVVIATGKTWHLAAVYAAELGVPGPVIALNGTFVKDWPDGTIRGEHGIPAARVEAIVAAVNGSGMHPVLSDREDRILADPALARWQRGFLDVYADRIDLRPEPWREAVSDPYFLAFLGDPAGSALAMAALEPFGGDGLEIFSADWPEHGAGMVVVQPRTDKGVALAAVAADLGIPREQVTAVGDWRNDRGMIEWAGTGVVMADAHPEVLAVADLILPFTSEEDGVAAYLEELLSAET